MTSEHPKRWLDSLIFSITEKNSKTVKIYNKNRPNHSFTIESNFFEKSGATLSH